MDRLFLGVPLGVVVEGSLLGVVDLLRLFGVAITSIGDADAATLDIPVIAPISVGTDVVLVGDLVEEIESSGNGAGAS